MWNISLKKKAMVLIPLTLAFFILLCVILTVFAVENKKEREKKELYEAEVADYNHTKNQLLKDYASVEYEEISKLGCRAALSLVVTEPADIVYSKLFNIICGDTSEPTGLTGIICLSPNTLPGMEGNMSWESFMSMISLGWTPAAFYKADTQDGINEPNVALLEEYIRAVKEIFLQRGLGTLDTVVFDSNTYFEEYGELLSSHGIEYVVRNANGIDAIETRVNTDTIAPLTPGYNKWNIKDANDAYVALLRNGGITAFLIEPSYFDDDNMQARINNFTRLVENYLIKNSKNGRLLVDNFDQALLMRQHFFEKKDAATSIINAKKQEIELKIAEIDRKITEIYKKYYAE